MDAARDLCDQALEIGTRLNLPGVQADALAARGLIEVVGTNDPPATRSAIEPLARACHIYRHLRRRPRLLMTLCDLARATYYAGSNDEFEAAISELDQLTPLFPGLQVTALLAKIELLMYAGAADAARGEIDQLLLIAQETNHTWAASKAEQLLLTLEGASTPDSS
jgi:hypothetical protein